MHVEIAKSKLEAANRYGNLLNPKAARDYAFSYIDWLRNGAQGFEPTKGRITHAIALEIRATINRMNLWIAE